MLRLLNNKIFNRLNLIIIILNYKRLNLNKLNVYTKILIKRFKKRY